MLIVGAIGGAGFAFTEEGVARILAGLGAAGLALVLVLSLAVLVPLQRRIISTPTSETGAIEAMRARWFGGNLGRSIVSVVSFALFVLAASAALS